MATLENIQAKISKLQVQAEQIAAKQKSGVLEKIHDLMEKHGVTTADIDAQPGGKRRGRKPGMNVAVKQRTVAPKYRDPKSGALWSGRGRAPAWIANVRDRSKFLIDGNSQAAAPVATGKGKASKRVTGPQPPMYLEPKTGATWSGRGRAPAWIANAKNRAKFLIGGADQSTGKEPAKPTEKAASVTKAASKKAPSAKKATGKKLVPAKKAATRKVAGRRAAGVKKGSAKTGTAKRAATAKRGRMSQAVTASVPPQSSGAVNVASSA